jgi:hypothetical protein
VSRRARELMAVIALAGALPGGTFLGGGTLVIGNRKSSIPGPVRPELPPPASTPQPGPKRGTHKKSRAERKRARAKVRP